MTENPYASPPDTPFADTEPKPKWKQAKMAWILPLGSTVFAIVMAPGLGKLLATTIVLASVIGGSVYTLLGFIGAQKYSNALPHAIGGCAVLIVIVALGMTTFMALARVVVKSL